MLSVKAWKMGYVLLCLLAGSARANDASLSTSGTPKLMNGHPSIVMESEVVRMLIEKEKVSVNCEFVFVNRGPATTVRMGFPDNEVFESEEEGGELKPHLLSFDSYVDGKQVKTTLTRGAKQGARWHVKDVVFPAKGRRVIRDVYEVPIGARITSRNTNAELVSYLLHTGASWHGNIGNTLLVVTFDRADMPTTLVPRLMEPMAKTKIFDKTWPSGAATVYYRGPSKPIVTGRILRFSRANWRPGPDDDLLLAFNNRKLKIP